MGIISGSGSFQGRFGDHFRVGDHSGGRDHFGGCTGVKPPLELVRFNCGIKICRFILTNCLIVLLHFTDECILTYGRDQRFQYKMVIVRQLFQVARFDRKMAFHFNLLILPVSDCLIKRSPERRTKTTSLGKLSHLMNFF